MGFKITNFNKLWIGETISLLGSQITILAIPLTALIYLDASPTAMGLLQAMSSLPFFLFALFIGVLVDNRRRKPILMSSNMISCILLMLIPILFWLDILSIPLLLILQFLLATMTVVFELTYLSYLPSLINKEEITSSNSKLEGSRAIAQVTGPSMGGLLIQLITAPFAIMVNILTYFISVLFLASITKKEDPPQRTHDVNIFRQIAEGLLTLIKNEILRSLSISTALLNFFGSAFSALYLIYVVKNLSINPTTLGTILGIGSIGALLGAGFANRINNKLGIGYTIIISTLISGFGVMLIPLISTDNLFITFPALVFSQVCIGFGGTVYFISQVSLRQAITPNHLLGRVNASNRFISRGLMPLGAFLGGLAGELLSVKTALIIISLGAFSPAIWTLLTPVKNIKKLSDINDNS